MMEEREEPRGVTDKVQMETRPTIAETLKEGNICEWLIYMWTAEDIVRSGRHREGDWAEFMHPWEREWWDRTQQQMEEENLMGGGHLSEAEDVLAELEDLHDELTSTDTQADDYKEAYLKAAPVIHALGGNEGLLRTCFVFLYGLLLLGLQHKEISEDTLQAKQTVSDMLSVLAGYYKKRKEEE